MGTDKNIKLHIVTDIKLENNYLNEMTIDEIPYVAPKITILLPLLR